MPIAVEQLLTPEINRPARYLGNELGAVHKPWDSANVRWVLTYPEIYEVGASNLGHIILYSILNAQPRQLCDRAYLPAADLATKLRESDTPLFAVESRRPLTDYDILGFSLSYELGATNILEMLSLAQVPLTWQERLDRGFQDPLIFAGGQTATSNPEPYAEFFDFVALGDGEELLPEVGLIIEQDKAAGLSRRDLLLDLAQVPGVYVPMFYDMAEDGSVHPNHPDVPKRVLRRVAKPMPAYSIGLVPYVETVHDRLTVEIRRGCTRGCRFCQPGMLTRPARDVEPEEVVETIEKGMRATGYNEFSLLSLSCSDYLSLPAVGMEIKNRLKDENVSLSLPSQRVDRFDENIANIIGGMRTSGITFAPEAGTQRMRDIINKGLTNEELLRGVKTSYESGWDKVKLYFMIGLPGETDADVLGIAETVRWLKKECRQYGNKNKRRPLNLNITISNFTPKPHTPFQWHSVSSSEFARKRDLLYDAFRGMRGVKVNYTDYRISAMEDFIGRGDRRLAPVVLRAWELGAGMDSWWESLERAFGAWQQAIEEAGLSWKYRQIDSGEWSVFNDDGSANRDATADESRYTTPLPWDHLNTGIDRDWLLKDLKLALEAATVPDCAYASCYQCGVCSPDFGHNIVVPPPPIPEFEGHFMPKTDRVQRFRVWFGKEGNMALTGHLDLVRLFDRIMRRASIPVSFSGGYHPSPRIAPANALPLGYTSSGEIVEFELAKPMDIETFEARLKEHFPEGMPVYRVEEVPVKSPSVTQCLTEAIYELTVETELESPQGSNNWEAWCDRILAETEVMSQRTNKKGKVRTFNLRERLFELEVVESNGAGDPDRAKIRYRGTSYNDGNLLRPSQVVEMFDRVIAAIDPLAEDAVSQFSLLHVHREALLLGD
ncbi:MAG: TIGR03960 family B12-binding radical SAM protein [Geitlerinemataceae cyanobacterium]